jgi:asparagine synthase (glutamine-hydrolysing)
VYLFNTRNYLSSATDIHPDYTKAPIIDGTVRLDNHLTICKDLELPSETQPLELLLQLYAKHKNDCTLYLIGDFSFCIFDPTKNTIFIARDHLGVKPLYYYRDKHQFICSDNPVVLSMEIVPEQHFEKSAVLNYLHSAITPLDRTLFTKIKRLPGAHQIHGSINNLTIERYWILSPNQQYSYYQTEEEYINKFRTLLLEAIHCRLPKNKVACELSGGIDSSTIVACATTVGNIEIHTYSNCFREQDRPARTEDEKHLVEDLALQHNFNIHLVNHHDDSIITLIQEGLKKIPYPLSEQVYIASCIMKKAHEDDCKVILSGFGGDEGVSHRGVGTIIREHFQKGQFLYAANALRTHGSLSLTSYIKTFIKSLIPDLIHKIKPIDRFPCHTNPFINPQFISDWKAPIKFPPFFKNTQDYMYYYLIESSCTTERLENFALLASSYDIEYRFPLLDIRLLEFFISIPPELKYRDGTNRYLMRQATRGLLPDSIRLRNDKSISECPDHENLIKNSLNRGHLPDLNPDSFLVNKLERHIISSLNNEPHCQLSIRDYDYEPILIYQLFENMYPDVKIVDT